VAGWSLKLQQTLVLSFHINKKWNWYCTRETRHDFSLKFEVSRESTNESFVGLLSQHSGFLIYNKSALMCASVTRQCCRKVVLPPRCLQTQTRCSQLFFNTHPTNYYNSGMGMLTLSSQSLNERERRVKKTRAMQLYHLIVALNNKGATLLQSNLQASLLFFQAALEATIAGRNDSSKGGDTVVPNPEGDISAFITIDENAHFGNAPFELLNAFVRPIVMNSSLTAYSRDPKVNLDVAACIITYNQAVVFHRLGLDEDDEPDPVRLDQAKKLYIKALSSFHDLEISTTKSSGHGVIDLVTMAIHNNLGQIAFYSCEHDEAMVRFAKLLLYAASVDANTYDAETAYILEWHKLFFRCNFLTIQFPKTASAA